MADEIIREVRRARHEISRRCGHDPHKVVASYRAFQEALKRTGEYQFFRPEEVKQESAHACDVPERAGS
jgi:hypothetical protein